MRSFELIPRQATLAFFAAVFFVFAPVNLLLTAAITPAGSLGTSLLMAFLSGAAAVSRRGREAVRLMTEAGQELGREAIERAILERAQRPLAEIRRAVFDLARAHGPQTDDRSLLLVRAGRAAASG